MSKEQELETSLMDFSWDNSEDFFGIAPEVKEVETQEKTVSKLKQVKDDEEDDKPVNLDSKKITEPEKEKEVFFDEDEEVSQSATSYSSVYKLLKEKGIISVNVEDETEFNEETFADVIEQEIEAGLDETIKAFMNDLDDDGKAFLKFKKEGGDTKQFFKFYSEVSQIPTPTIGDSKSEEKFLKYYYKAYEDLDDEDIEDKIEFLKETGKLTKYAQKYHENVEDEIEQNREEAIKKQQQYQLQQEEHKKQYVKELKGLIDDVDNIKDWSITQKDKKVLHGYMTRASVKVSENQYLTQFQNDLQQVFKDKEKTILLAKIIGNDFDLTDLKEKAKTEMIRETKSKLTSSKTSPISNKGSRNKGLSDYFN